MQSEQNQRLFSYGTLQQENVQLAQFGRRLDGEPDELPGFRRSSLKITDPRVVAKSGKADHPIIYPTGDPRDTIAGMVFRVSEEELAAADTYEVHDYHRVPVRLSSGIAAWAYVGGDRRPGAE